MTDEERILLDGYAKGCIELALNNVKETHKVSNSVYSSDSLRNDLDFEFYLKLYKHINVKIYVGYTKFYMSPDSKEKYFEVTVFVNDEYEGGNKYIIEAQNQDFDSIKEQILRIQREIINYIESILE